MASKVSVVKNRVIQTINEGDDVHISFEDQQKINKFAKQNARMDDLKAELEMHKNDLKSVEEALEEVELLDEDEDVPFMAGEVFLLHKQPKSLELLQEIKKTSLEEIAAIEAKANIIRTEMNELKAHLYQRFGSNISLENDE